MNCEQAREQLSALLDDELAGAARAQLEAHLARCAGCTGEHDSLRALHSALGHWETSDLSEWSTARIESRLNAHVQRQLRWRFTLRWSSALATTATAVALLAWLPRPAVVEVQRPAEPPRQPRVEAPRARTRVPSPAPPLLSPRVRAPSTTARIIARAPRSHTGRKPIRSPSGQRHQPEASPAAIGADLARIVTTALAESSPTPMMNAKIGVVPDRVWFDLLTETQ